MIVVPRSEFTEDMVPSNRIGVHGTESTVTIFMPGDEETPEWIALHPPYVEEPVSP